MMKHRLLVTIVCLFVFCIFGSCSKSDDSVNCKIFWQIYNRPKYAQQGDIEKAFQDTFFGYYEKVNDNTVKARGTSAADVRSVTRQLCSMADAKIVGPVDPDLNQEIEVRVFIEFDSHVEETWSKNYR